MRNLRKIRIILSAIFIVAAVAYLAALPRAGAYARVAEKSQLIPSAIGVTLGVTLVWLAVTLLLGRVYCSSVCPVGTLQDMAAHLRRIFPRLRHPYRFRHARRVRYDILIIYCACLLLGFMAVPYALEPWNICRNVASAANPHATASTWVAAGIPPVAGMLAGIAVMLAVLVSAVISGRGFCNTVCPLGTAMGALDRYTLMHIEIDPDRCVSCMKCEDSCKAGCVKVVSRYVDNSRCIRCFNCLDACRHDAIRYQKNRNRRPASPLMRRVRRRGLS